VSPAVVLQLRRLVSTYLPELVGFATLLAIMMILSRFEYVPGTGFHYSRPRAISGDEPHYLVTVNSLLLDGDLDLSNNYRSSRQGGHDAGRLFRSRELDHHSLLVNSVTRERARFHEVYAGGLPPCPWYPDCPQDQLSPRFADRAVVRELSSHPLGFPVLIAGALAALRPTPRQIELYSVQVVVVISWLAVVLTYVLCRRLGLSRTWAAGAVATLLGSSWLPYSKSFYSEPAIGLFLVVALLAMQSGQPILAGLAVAAAAACKAPFLLVGGVWFLERLWAGRGREALLMAASTGGAFGGSVLLSFVTTGIPVASGHQGLLPPDGLRNLFLSLFDQSHGVLPYVPWAFVGFIGCFKALDPKEDNLMARWIALACLSLLVVLASWGSTGGHCYGPRFWVPLLPALAILSVLVVKEAGRALRLAFSVVVGLSAFFAVNGWVRYSQSFNSPLPW